MKKKKVKEVSVSGLYDVWAEDYDKQNNLLFFLEEQISYNLFNFRGKDILDLGCGTGRYAVSLAKKNRVVAVDFNKKMLGIAKKKAEKARVEIKFIQGNVIDFKTEKKFDIIISMMVQDQIKDLEKVGKVIFSASKKGTDVFTSNVHPIRMKEILSKGKSEILPGYLIEEYSHPLEEYLRVFGKLGFKLIKKIDIVFENRYFNIIEAPEELRNKTLGVLYHFRKMK